MSTSTRNRRGATSDDNLGEERKHGRPTFRVLTHLAAYSVTLVVLLPLLWIVLLSFKRSDQILANPLSLEGLTLANYTNVLDSIPLISMYGRTIFIAIVSVSAGAIVSFMLSFALVNMEFKRPRLQTVLRSFILAGLAVPVYILLFPVYRLELGLGLYGSYWSLILPYTAISIPFNTLLLTGFLRELPREIEEAAIIDGVGLFQLCWRVVVPLMRPGIATVLIFNVIYVFNEFPFVSILISDPDRATLSLAVSQFQGQYGADYGSMMAAATLILVPQVVIYFLFQKQVVAGMTLGAVKG